MEDRNEYLTGALLIALLDLGERGYTELHINDREGLLILLAKNPNTNDSVDLFETQLVGLKELYDNLNGGSHEDLDGLRGDIMWMTIIHALSVIVQRSVKPADRPMVLAELIEDVLIPIDIKQPIAMGTGEIREYLENSIKDTQQAINIMTAFTGKESDNND